MDLFTHHDLMAILAECQPPCVSIYMSTHPGGAEEDPIRWKGSLNQADEWLTAQGMRPADVKEFLAPARNLLHDPEFWKSQCGGLAFFLAPQFTRLYRLPTSFENVVTVGARFRIKPLARMLSGDGRFYVLAISRNAIRLMHGTRHTISDIDTRGLPKNLADARRTHDVDNMLSFHTRPAGGIGNWGAIFHGHGVGIDDEKDDLLKYFQQINHGLHPLLKEEKAPLVLASVEYLLPIYRVANTYPHLLETGIHGNPDHLSRQELHERAWAIVAPHFGEPQRSAAALYEQLIGTGRASNDLEEVLEATREGLVSELFVADDRPQWGTCEPVVGTVVVHDHQEPGDEDLLDLAVANTLRHGGVAYIVGSKDVPGQSPLAAVYRLPYAKAKV